MMSFHHGLVPAAHRCSIGHDRVDRISVALQGQPLTCIFSAGVKRRLVLEASEAGAACQASQDIHGRTWSLLEVLWKNRAS